MCKIKFQSKNIEPQYDKSPLDFIIINKCEGYSLVKAVFDETNQFLYFVGWVAGELQPYYPSEYEVWAMLPNSVEYREIVVA
ncbi:hypothetical protein AAH678_01555 [Sodalis endosymbiont of Spalangia cameroni]|uniref:hypothetical protein n=1 Tax=Sodalis praecaptivus TaxID=1239307 RepID=UPI0031F94B6B